MEWHLRYTELYSYFITFFWFLTCENVNCAFIVSPLNATLYYVFIENFQKHLAPNFINKYLNIEIKRSLQKLHVSLFMDKLEFCRKCCSEKRIAGI